MTRKSIPQTTQVIVLKKCRRRCALCFYFVFDANVKDGQIAHIDQNNENSEEDNLAYLCLNHHNQYDTKPSQTKRITESELKEAKKQLEDFIATQHQNIVPIATLETINNSKSIEGEKINIDVYRLGYPIYDAFRNFVKYIVQEGELDIAEFYEFKDKTHDTLFLYGKEISEFLYEVTKRAITLRHKQNLMKIPERYDNEQWDLLVNEETEQLLWFSNIVEEGRRIFSKYLKI